MFHMYTYVHIEACMCSSLFCPIEGMQQMVNLVLLEEWCSKSRPCMFLHHFESFILTRTPYGTFLCAFAGKDSLVKGSAVSWVIKLGMAGF